MAPLTAVVHLMDRDKPESNVALCGDVQPREEDGSPAGRGRLGVDPFPEVPNADHAICAKCVVKLQEIWVEREDRMIHLLDEAHLRAGAAISGKQLAEDVKRVADREVVRLQKKNKKLKKRVKRLAEEQELLTGVVGGEVREAVETEGTARPPVAPDDGPDYEGDEPPPLITECDVCPPTHPDVECPDPTKSCPPCREKGVHHTCKSRIEHLNALRMSNWHRERGMRDG